MERITHDSHSSLPYDIINNDSLPFLLFSGRHGSDSEFHSYQPAS